LTVKRFLDAEFRFSRLIGDVQKIINESAGDILDRELLQMFDEALMDDDEYDGE
ncbi:MAG: hypothetical protein GX878_03455, partial [Firmicutes bacterium]|nr:hypothetical protein [Bacillota bacterium]